MAAVPTADSGVFFMKKVGQEKPGWPEGWRIPNE